MIMKPGCDAALKKNKKNSDPGWTEDVFIG